MGTEDEMDCDKEDSEEERKRKGILMKKIPIVGRSISKKNTGNGPIKFFFLIM